MLDPRIYRAALLPVVLALVVVAFSLSGRPEPLRTPIVADAFDGARALRVARVLQAAVPDRRTGSLGDAKLAGLVAAELRRALPGVPVVRRVVAARTIDGRRDLVTVSAQQPGSAPAAQLVVVAPRDTLGPGGLAQLTGTAVMLELARVIADTRPLRSVTFATVSGSTGGQGGMRDLVAHLPRPVDALLELGDLGGPVAHRPLVVPWSEGAGMAPQRLQRTVALALRQEARVISPTAPARRQLARFTWPVTVSGQGIGDAAGIPAVRLSTTGELPPEAGSPVTAERLERFGRATLRALTALESGSGVGTAPERDLVIRRKILPEWAVRLLLLALLLPPLLTGVDAVARLRRRGAPLRGPLLWTLSFAVPFLLVGLFARVLGIAGAVADTAPPALPDAVPLDGGAWAAMGCCAVALALGFLLLRPVLGRRALRDVPPATELALAPVLVTCAAGLVACILNPYAGLLIVLPANLWLLVAARERRMRRPTAVALVLVSLVPFVLALGSVASQLGLSARQALWFGLLSLAGGHTGPVAVLGWSVVAGAGAAVLAAVWRAVADPDREPPITVRGPATYAGPGSLGGTSSARRP